MVRLSWAERKIPLPYLQEGFSLVIQRVGLSRLKGKGTISSSWSRAPQTFHSFKIKSLWFKLKRDSIDKEIRMWRHILEWCMCLRHTEIVWFQIVKTFSLSCLFISPRWRSCKMGENIWEKFLFKCLTSSYSDNNGLVRKLVWR